ncbi:isochorismatase family protein [Allopusillimonas ginsengisoli]|uniref:isochorismatase family protein n=1 Tax=Allopusillimonas ginsengisoli TaxID=453575 RepID=UPI00102121E3|nr:isochorismatase family protein [Allopusillimonas ginsengisoli]TEA79995.1 isochorismatase family protein [Allopusillimonas ginsengisoli]
MTTLWESYLSEKDIATIRRGGFSRRMGFGSRPAVIVIDAQKYMIGEANKDEHWPSSCGEVGREAADAITKLVDVAQRSQVPCFFSRFELAADGSDMGVYSRKRDLLASEHWCLSGSVGAQLIDGLQPADGDVVFVKKKPSGFHGTPLLGYLVDRGIDTVIIVGGATSNCIRATVFDAASYNFRTIVPKECVFDRINVSHIISLFDMDRQFADVVDMQDAITYLQELEPVVERKCL